MTQQYGRALTFTNEEDSFTCVRGEILTGETTRWCAPYTTNEGQALLIDLRVAINIILVIRQGQEC